MGPSACVVGVGTTWPAAPSGEAPHGATPGRCGASRPTIYTRAVAQRTAIRLTGDTLRVADVWEVAHGETPVEVSDEAHAKMQAARALVERAAHGAREHTYGVNTGFGRFVSKSIPEELTEE